MKFRNVDKETNGSQHFTCRSSGNEAVSFRTRQLKIGTTLQKTEVSFLYKAVVENSFSIISIANYHFKSVVFLEL